MKIYWEPGHTRREVFNDGDRPGGIGGDRPDFGAFAGPQQRWPGIHLAKGPTWLFFRLNDDLTCPSKICLHQIRFWTRKGMRRLDGKCLPRADYWEVESGLFSDRGQSPTAFIFECSGVYPLHQDIQHYLPLYRTPFRPKCITTMILIC